MLNISEIVKKTEDMFDLFNWHFYQNELQRPAITVSPDGGRGAYGWCSVSEVWEADGNAYHEINLCAEYLDRPIAEVCATMLHEMAHLYNLQHEMMDVSNNGYYHNNKFKKTAEAHGLTIAKHPRYGWTITEATPETQEWLLATLGEHSINASRKMLMEISVKGGRQTSKNRSIKYVCPNCGTSVRATKVVNIVCGDCDVPFER